SVFVGRRWRQDVTGRDTEFVEFVRTRGPSLRRTAFLLCGDWHHAEDLVQIALLKLFRAWSRIKAAEAVDSYARTVLVRTAVDESRRIVRRREDQKGTRLNASHVQLAYAVFCLQKKNEVV